MKSLHLSAALLAACNLFAFGCAAETDTEQAPVATQEAALGLHPGCNGFRDACREGNEKLCAAYSEYCEVRIGVIGDSLSDEYQGSSSLLPGIQWTSQVQGVSRISMGPYAARPEPRNEGYRLNWARFGQAALDLQWNDADVRATPACAAVANDSRLDGLGSFDAQIHGLGAQIAAGEVDVALVWVGHNDLFIRSCYGYGEEGPQALFEALVGRIIEAALTLQAYASADPEYIKSKIAIVGLAGDASALNPSLEAAAASFGIPFIDPFNTTVTEIITEQATTGYYDVGGTPLTPFELVPEITPTSGDPADIVPPGTPGAGPCGIYPVPGTDPVVYGYGCSTPAYAEAFRHWDAVHPNTLYMGAIGNQIVSDLNATFGFTMDTITDDQLLDTAGL